MDKKMKVQKHIQKVVTLVLPAVLTISLASCGTKTDTDKTTTVTLRPSQSTDSASETPASDASLEKSAENKVSTENLLTNVTVEGNVTNYIFNEAGYEDMSEELKHWAIWDDYIWGIHSEIALFANCDWLLEYDDAGNLISETWNDDYNNTGIMTYTYDENGNLLTETAAKNGIVTHKKTIERDSNGKMISQITETLPESDAGYSIKTKYDEYENIVRSENGQSQVINTYDRAYDDSGNPLSETWKLFQPMDATEPNDIVTTTYEYDSNGNLLRKEVVRNIAQIREEYIYTRTDDGKPLTCDYQVDTVYGGRSAHTEWEYDDAGNIISKAWNDSSNSMSVESYTYDSDGNLLRYNNQENYENETIEYTYDEKGNQTEVKCTYEDQSHKNYTIWREFYEDGTMKTEHLIGANIKGIYYRRQCAWDQKGNLLEVLIQNPYASELLDITFGYGTQKAQKAEQLKVKG